MNIQTTINIIAVSLSIGFGLFFYFRYKRKLANIRKDVSTGRIGIIESDSKGICEIEELCKTDDGKRIKVRFTDIRKKWNSDDNDDVARHFTVGALTKEDGYYIGWVSPDRIKWFDNWKAINRNKKLEKI